MAQGIKGTRQGCSVDGCDRPMNARGWCLLHYSRAMRHGDPLIASRPKPTCAVDACDRLARSLGWCLPHYKRWKRHGDPLGGRRPLVSDWEERVDKDGPLPVWAPFLGPCWIWTGRTEVGGYGVFAGKRVHRLSFERYVGPIPAELEMDHLCRVRHCVNPDHLEAVTHRENDLRSPITPWAKNARKTHCIRNHEFTEANTYRTATGSRKCRECQRQRKVTT